MQTAASFVGYGDYARLIWWSAQGRWDKVFSVAFGASRDALIKKGPAIGFWAALKVSVAAAGRALLLVDALATKIGGGPPAWVISSFATLVDALCQIPPPLSPPRQPPHVTPTMHPQPITNKPWQMTSPGYGIDSGQGGIPPRQ